MTVFGFNGRPITLLKLQLHLISGNGYPAAEYDDGGWDGDRGYARGRGRGRGRNFRGRGRGGYNGPQFDMQQDARGYNQEAPARGYDQEAPAQGRGIASYNCSLFSA